MANLQQDQSQNQPSLPNDNLLCRWENGRKYHLIGDGHYILPSDEEEQQRLDTVNHLWMLALDGKFCLCPKDNSPTKRVLDLGTGTGTWAIDYADVHTEAMVLGVDLSPMQPSALPPNCLFEIADLGKEWTFLSPSDLEEWHPELRSGWLWNKLFDFIFARDLNGSSVNWEGVLAQAYVNLEPGGYLEVQNSLWPPVCDDDTFREDSAFLKWSHLMVEACNKMGSPIDKTDQMAIKMEAAGFKDIQTTKISFPASPWPRNEKLRELGMWNQRQLFSGLEALSLRPFTRGLSWSQEDTVAFCSVVREELKGTKIHAYWNGSVVHGRKPL